MQACVASTYDTNSGAPLISAVILGTTRKALEFLMITGDLANKVRDLRGVESERNKLRAALQELEREAEKMNRRLNAAPKVLISQASCLDEVQGGEGGGGARS